MIGGSIKGSVIEGGTIRGARLEGATGKFTGALEVNQLIGGNLCEVFIARVDNSIHDDVYSARINFAPSPVRRVVFIVNSSISFFIEANNPHSYNYNVFKKGNRPPEIFLGAGFSTHICLTAYAVSNTTTMSQ